MRLLQLTSGLLGGDFTLDETNPDEPVIERLPPKEISNEKQCWAVEYITNETQARALIVWCRWRRERELLAKALADEKVLVYEYYGGQSKTERLAAELTFDRPWQDQTQKLVLLAQPQAGGRGRNFTAATEVVYLSQSHSLEQRLQTEDRVHRPGQTRPVTYVDVIATGPQGQRTIDHAVVKALRDHQELARWTCAAWRRALEEE
jgi:SNF2 family DNA or RNA helicase